MFELQRHSQHEHLDQLQHIVAIGGGHGLGRLMSALSFMKERLTGIVTTTDNGGSTGRIRDSQGGIAWGDLRNCLNQIIIEASTASALFEYRFQGNGELAGHNLGNLMLSALADMQVRPLEAVNLVRDLLKVKSFLLPMSEAPVHLGATSQQGEKILGEVNVDSLAQLPQSLWLSPAVPATPEALQAIQQAEVIVFGPGSFFTSILPPLLLPEIASAIQASSALKIFIDNLGVEHSPAAQLSLADRIHWLHRIIGKEVLDAVIVDPSVEPQALTTFKDQRINLMLRPLKADDVSYRHDRTLLCKAIDALLGELKYRPNQHIRLHEATH